MTDIVNASFETGDLTGWVPPVGVVTTVGPGYGVSNGSNSCHFDAGTPGLVDLLQENPALVWVGKTITASCDYFQGAASSGRNTGQIVLRWYDGSDEFISEVLGNLISSSRGNRTTTVTGTAPEGAVGVRVGIRLNKNRSDGCAVDNFRWNLDSEVAVELVYPIDGSTYVAGDEVPFRVTIDSDLPVVSVEYIATNTSTAIETSCGVSTTSPYAVNFAGLTAGSYTVVAEVTLQNGYQFTSLSNALTIGTPTPPDTREFKASNAYTNLIAKNFVGIADAMPPTANVVGAAVSIDYSVTALIRSKDIDVSDLTAARYSAAFDMVPSVTFEAVLLDDNSGTYTANGGAMVSQGEVNRSDYTVVEDGTSENKRWTVLDGSAQTITIGGETELFGLDYMPASEFITKALGLRFYPNLGTKPDFADSGDACFRCKIDKLRLQVYFDAGSVEYYFVSPDTTQVIKGRLAAAYVDGGKFENGDASGIMQLASDLEIIEGTARTIEDDWAIHSGYPATSLNRIGTVSATMGYNGLPSYYDVESARSRYQFISANFYGDLTYDSIYGVNGVDRAFSYNGDWFYKIHTQPEAEKDKPRHVEYYHTHLALGYGEGRVDISVVGEPYNFDGADGASSWAVGDSVTGLLNLSGTMLGIFCQKSIHGLAGTTVDNFATQVLSPKIGAIEYTIADMGFPVYANAYGIYTLAQTTQYGDYLGTPMSQDISPWLRPRLVRKETSDKEVVVAWPVRAKNQYRLAFADGYVLTMTINGGNQAAPTFSKQKYYIASEQIPVYVDEWTSIFNAGATISNIAFLVEDGEGGYVIEEIGESPIVTTADINPDGTITFTIDEGAEGGNLERFLVVRDIPSDWVGKNFRFSCIDSPNVGVDADFITYDGVNVNWVETVSIATTGPIRYEDVEMGTPLAEGQLIDIYPYPPPGGSFTVGIEVLYPVEQPPESPTYEEFTSAAIVPAAISSELDDGGKERIHTSNKVLPLRLYNSAGSIDLSGDLPDMNVGDSP